MRTAALALALAAACGGSADLPVDPDAPHDTGHGDGSVDGPPADAPVDAAIDAPPPPPFSGTFSLLEEEVRVAGAPGPLGQGLTIDIAFADNAALPMPVMEEQAGPQGCKAWEYTPAEAALADTGIDEGTLFFTFSGGTAPATAPVIPRCSFVAGAGYRCEDFATVSSGGVVAAGPMAGTALFTDHDVAYTAANSRGRWLRIEGAAIAGNNGLFPILDVAGPSSVVYANPRWEAEVLPGAAMHVNVAGVGPIPGVADPGFVADDVAVSVNHVAGGGDHVPAFTIASAGPGHAGDDVTLDLTSHALLTRVPVDGSELTFTCASGCGDAATTTIVELITTDGPVGLLPPAAMPAPITKQVRVRCTADGAASVVVPAAYSARLMTAGATRIRASFIRASRLAWPTPPVDGLLGHANVGITTP